MKPKDPGDARMSAQEQEFEAYLQQRSLLGEHGQEDAAPPAALDAQVLQAAHDALRAGTSLPRPAAPRRAPFTRWALPGSVAAAVLVTAAVFMHSGMQTTITSRAQRTEQGTAAVEAPSAALNAAPAAAPRVQQPARAESDPQAWLARIEALRAQGKQQQADEQLQRLRAAFPDYPIVGAENSDATAKRAKPATERTPK